MGGLALSMECQKIYSKNVNINSDLSMFINNSDKLMKEFKIYKYSQCRNIFNENNEFIMPAKDKCVILVNGPIAGGKSVIIANLIKIYGLSGREYINSEYFYFNDFGDCNSLEDGYKMGKRKGLERIYYNLERGNSFIYEFVLAKKEKYELIQKFKELNYTIIGLLISTNKEISHNRALSRECDGFYKIDKNKIDDRYTKVLKSQHYFMNTCDYCYLISNNSVPTYINNVSEI